MWALLLQSAVLLLAAYFVGVWIGCIARRLATPTVTKSEMAAPASPVGAPTEAAVARAAAAVQAGAATATASSAPDIESIARRMETIEPVRKADAPAAVSGEAESVETVSGEDAAVEPEPPAPEPAPVTPPPVAPSAPPPAVVAAPPSAPAPAKVEPFPPGLLPAATGTDGASAVAVPVEAVPAPMPAPSGPSQDLTAIRGLDSATAMVLEREGVQRYDQIAAWTPGDVARINRALGGMHRVEQENWIEQAAILAAGGSTVFLREKQAGTTQATPAPTVNLAAASDAIADPPPPPTVSTGDAPAAEILPAADDLTLIRGIDAAARDKLAALGVQRFADIAAWAPDDVREANAALGSRRRVQQENWIEQAQFLADGRRSAFVRAGVASHLGLAAPTPDQGTPIDLAGLIVASAQSATTSAVDPSGDDLQRIDGINAEVEKLLRDQGIKRFAQLASLDVKQIARLNGLLGIERRVERERWVEQARQLGGINVPAASPELPIALVQSRSNDPASTSDLAKMRSVRSEAYRPAGAGPAGPPDDLKRIRGVGALIERKLNAMGITTYGDVANWTRADIERVSQQLDFRGRIERENWVDQARILASGGQTEFSRRFDRSGDT